MRECFVEQSFYASSRKLIDIANAIIEEYQAKGFSLTLRQLYYQFVARGYIPNKQSEYKRLGEVINKARLAGLIDWDAIEDRTRSFDRRTRWENGRQILQASADSFHMDMWEGQEYRPFVIIEKEALVGVLARICRQYDVPLLAARGYPSGTVLREFAVEDILPNIHDQRIVIIHLGDHDPSGLDMTRDLRERIEMFSEFDSHGNEIEMHRVALNMDQIKARKPPPNPAKTTDSRFGEYRRRYGDKSWELDALPPEYLVELVEKNVQRFLDAEVWNKRRAYVEGVRAKIAKLAETFAA